MFGFVGLELFPLVYKRNVEAGSMSDTFLFPSSGFRESVHGWMWFVAGLIFSDFRGACQPVTNWPAW